MSIKGILEKILMGFIFGWYAIFLSLMLIFMLPMAAISFLLCGDDE